MPPTSRRLFFFVVAFLTLRPFRRRRLAGGSRVDAVRDPHVQREQSPGTVPQDRGVRQVLQPFPVSCRETNSYKYSTGAVDAPGGGICCCRTVRWYCDFVHWEPHKAVVRLACHYLYDKYNSVVLSCLRSVDLPPRAQ